jgi:23S rRNA pseudouridine2605 synthase
MAEERLQKIIARAGIASRREAETLIRDGAVTVNGKVVTEMGTRADPEKDHIKVKNRLITRREPERYILLYKPREVMTTVTDPEGRLTVIDLLQGVSERVFPVGRLDYQSEGLLLLTNDGDLANRLTHPKFGCEKTYHVKVRGVPEENVLQKLRRGVVLEGKRTKPCEIERLKTTGRRADPTNSWLVVRLREGRTQQIRKMFLFAGHPVQRLRRVAISVIEDPVLEPGMWRDLTEAEVRSLRRILKSREQTK